MNLKKYTINGTEYNVAVNSVTFDSAEVVVNGVTYQVKIENTRGSDSVSIPAEAPVSEVSVKADVSDTVAVTGAGKAVNSPLPGVIVGIKVKVGDIVKAGQVVAILEAMKMENEIQSEYDGTVISINASQGDSVLEGAPIVMVG